MLISRLQKRLNDTSISRKLYFTIGFTALLVVVELCTLWFSITILSAVRSYVGGEGLWSKAQKDAILNLREYAYSHNAKDYVAFQKFLEVPYGDNEMTRKFGGTGIGLTIVKHLVALQHGEISVSSIPGEGSEFCFRLPFLLKHDEEHKQAAPASSFKSGKLGSDYGKGINVLIVEDNAINQLLVLRLLQKHSYQTTVAENGKVAFEQYQTQDFDIILMDLQMPEMDGYETTVNIRNMKSNKRNVPIVAMTAHTITGDYEKCMAIGINEYISKPFHPDELYHKIQLLVTHHN
jgi:CheY-like chemotaxis protein